MIQRFIIIVAILLNGSLYSQTIPPPKLSFKKTIYSCDNANLTIVGFDSNSVYLKSNCSDKSEDLIYDIKSGKLTTGAINSTNLVLREYIVPTYSRDTSKLFTELRYRLRISKFNDDDADDDQWKIYSHTWVLKSGEKIYVGYATGSIDFHGLYEFGTHGMYSSYDINKDAILGIGITKFDSNGQAIWDKTFNRGLLLNTNETGDAESPLLIQKGNYIYLIYVDEDQQFYEQSFNNLSRLTNIHKKYELICQQININDGTNQQLLIGSKIATAGVPILKDLLSFNDQTMVLLSTNHKANYYQVSRISLKSLNN